MKHNHPDQEAWCPEKIKMLQEKLTSLNAVAIAFSGGVDSVFLLAAALEAGLEKVLAVTVDSCFVTREEIRRAERLAHEFGADHHLVKADILSSEEVAQNSPERCYFCKKEIFKVIRQAARAKGIDCFLHGVNLDDLGDYRPGLKAAKELAFGAPLLEAGFSKADIRACSRAMGLETWDLPSQSCLAARIPFHEPITRDKLERIEKAEACLKALGFAQVRVRSHGDLARIETGQAAVSRIAGDEALRRQISAALKQVGFAFVSLDLEGYATGRMNRVIDKDVV